MPSEEMKARMKSCAHSIVEEDCLSEREEITGNGWKYALNSCCSAAFHDESRWDNVSFEAHDMELPIPGEEYVLLTDCEGMGWKGMKPDRMSCELFSGFDCSILAYQKNISDIPAFAHHTVILFVVRTHANSQPELSEWIVFCRDTGCW